jgi:hypothetical protein
VHLPKVRLAAVDIAPVTLPAFTLNGRRYPARRLPGRHIPGRTIPGRTLKGDCFTAPASFAPSRTTVRVSGYDRLDPDFSDQLSSRYWADSDVSTPDPTAAGFGELNAAGYPRNQYVRPYVSATERWSPATGATPPATGYRRVASSPVKYRSRAGQDATGERHWLSSAARPI